MSKERNSAYLIFLKKHLRKNKKILDLACGYGRLTFPLVKLGYNIEGIDLAPNFIRDAKKLAKQKGMNIKFRTGNMLKLPYNDNSFDSIICMWSSFNHILSKKDQIKALNEMFRTLKKEGFAIIDMPNHKIIKGKHLVKDKISGFENTDFIHNRYSLINILKKSKIRKYNIKVQKIGEKKRLILFLYR